MRGSSVFSAYSLWVDLGSLPSLRCSLEVDWASVPIEHLLLSGSMEMNDLWEKEVRLVVLGLKAIRCVADLILKGGEVKVLTIQ